MRGIHGARPGDAVLITGGSSDLGLETALYLAARGRRVYATTRDLAKRPAMLRAAAERGVHLEVLQLDVTDRASIDAAVDEVVGEAGGLYALVNNAGRGLRGCLEDLAEEEIRQVFEVNVFGTMAVTRAVLPHLRTAGRGRIVIISSVGGRLASYGLTGYCASRFALEGFGESLALEVAPFGLQVVLVEPGIIKTAYWTVGRGIARNALNPASPYYARFRRQEELADAIAERSRNRPIHVARAVHHALTTPSPRLRYVVGQPASLLFALRRYLPGETFDRAYSAILLRLLEERQRPQERPA